LVEQTIVSTYFQKKYYTDWVNPEEEKKEG
jgi:hypothetical protein